MAKSTKSDQLTQAAWAGAVLFAIAAAVSGIPILIDRSQWKTDNAIGFTAETLDSILVWIRVFGFSICSALCGIFARLGERA